MKKLIYANLKMNQTTTQTETYCEKLKKIETDNTVGIAFSFTSLCMAKKSLTDTKFQYGAQNVYFEEKGAFTGEISAQMLKEIGCEFCLVGHSERRIKFGETNSAVNKKIKALNKFGIKSILCIGEKANERANGKTKEVITKQIEECLAGLYENELENITIAYEPIWAISTFSKDGKTATPKQACEVNKHIKHVIKNLFSDKASEKIKILYGGSVSESNAKKYMLEKEIDGILVGGASLDIDKFEKIIKL